MNLDAVGVRKFLQRYWLPILAFAVLCIACQDSNFDDGRRVAKLFSGPYYKIYIVISVIVLLGVAIQRRKMRTIFWGLELTLFCLVITNVVKYSLPLGRPPRMRDGIAVIGGYSPGFPSAHTAFAFGLAWLIFVLKPRYSPLWFAMAVTVGWSRVELRAHYTYQVLCGAILGIVLAHFISSSLKGVTQTAFSRFRKNRHDTEIASTESAANPVTPDVLKP